MQIKSLSGNVYLFDPMTNKIYKLHCPDTNGALLNLKTNFKIVRPKRDHIREMIRNHANNLILELTDQCNCRCGYCVFSGRFFHERKHGNNNMDIGLGKKAIDLFFRHSAKSSHRVINFYGGEPLLQKDLLLELVDYARAKDETIFFHVSTNLTLVDDCFIKECQKKRISMTVTLDGPKDVHNKWRPFADGTGSFDTVLANLKMIYEKHPDYFSGALAIIFNLVPGADASVIFDFIDYHPIIRKVRKFRLNTVELADSNLEIYADFTGPKIDEEHLRLYVSWLLQPDDKVPILHHLLWPGVKSLLSRESEPNKFVSLNHCCIPGKHRMFVNLQGRISACEKCGEYLTIGNLEQGLDEEKIWSWINRYYESAQTTCTKCQIARFCNLCFIWCKHGSEMNFERKAIACENRKIYIQTCFRVLVSVLENNPDFSGVGYA